MGRRVAARRWLAPQVEAAAIQFGDGERAWREFLRGFEGGQRLAGGVAAPGEAGAQYSLHRRYRFRQDALDPEGGGVFAQTLQKQGIA